MDEKANLNEEEHSSERFWFKVLGILGLSWLVGYVVPWFTWDYVWGYALSGLAALSGSVGALMWLVAAAVLRSKRMLAAAFATVACVGLTYSGWQDRIKMQSTLALNESRYMKIVDDVMKSPSTWNELGQTREVGVDTTGGGVRVAFDLGEGYMGDFPSIIYDQEGSLRAPSYGELTEELPFSGQYHSVRHVRGPWYFAYLYPD